MNNIKSNGKFNDEITPLDIRNEGYWWVTVNIGNLCIKCIFCIMSFWWGTLDSCPLACQHGWPSDPRTLEHLGQISKRSGLWVVFTSLINVRDSNVLVLGVPIKAYSFIFFNFFVVWSSEEFFFLFALLVIVTEILGLLDLIRICSYHDSFDVFHYFHCLKGTFLFLHLL